MRSWKKRPRALDGSGYRKPVVLNDEELGELSLDGPRACSKEVLWRGRQICLEVDAGRTGHLGHWRTVKASGDQERWTGTWAFAARRLTELARVARSTGRPEVTEGFAQRIELTHRDGSSGSFSAYFDDDDMFSELRHGLRNPDGRE